VRWHVCYQEVTRELDLERYGPLICAIRDEEVDPAVARGNPHVNVPEFPFYVLTRQDFASVKRKDWSHLPALREASSVSVLGQPHPERVLTEAQQ
jgi:hypothetical protein